MCKLRAGLIRATSLDQAGPAGPPSQSYLAAPFQTCGPESDEYERGKCQFFFTSAVVHRG